MPYRLRKNFGTSACNFIEEIIDGMQDWVRVISMDNRVMFVNRSMREALGNKVIIGRKCYETLGRDIPCPNCISRHNFDDLSASKEEVIDGRIFAVTSSPLRNHDTGTIEAVIEVLHDITELKELSRELEKQNEKLRDDLSMARRLQCSLLPKNELKTDKVDFSFIYRPCETLGGDFLDIYQIDADHIGVYIADVSGHGVAASMLTMFLRTALDKSLLSPAKALSQLYTYFNKNGFSDELYIAIFYGIINISNFTFTYANAGLNVCPIIFSKDNLQILRAPGIPISNWVEDPDYVEMTIDIKSKDRMFFYTDGIIEIRNSENAQFGEERIVEHLQETDLHPSHTLSKLIDKAISFSERKDSKDIIDDITVALIEIK
ncbi:MAG: domain S-box [Eubacterium sp.]|nr:domain S-box [Eubacterium sp.]